MKREMTSSDRSGGPPDSEPCPVVGVVGLGTMGGAMARHLLDAGYRVVGCDVDPTAALRCAEAGALIVDSATEVANVADVTILSLPSTDAFENVVYGERGLLSGTDRRCKIVVETSTLPLDLKRSAREVLAGAGMEMLDCPISGTGEQMVMGDAVFYASGLGTAIRAVGPVLSACGREVFDLGGFGNGTKLKLVANLLVTIHNASAAEALVLAQSGGIDPSVALPALVAGAGSSRMLERRGPLMVTEKYEPVSMEVRLFLKDIAIISAFAAESGCSVEVFDAAARLHQLAFDAGWGEVDPASVHAVVRRRARS